MYDRWEIQRLKEMIPMSNLLMNLGFQKINPRTQRAACMLHGGKNETSFYWKKDYFNCFSCHRYGDKIELVKIVKGFDFRRTIDFLVSLTGYPLRSNDTFKTKKIKYEQLEIPQYIIDRIKNQNFEKIQIEEKIRKMIAEQENLTNILVSMRKNDEKYTGLNSSIESRLNDLDSDLRILTYYLHQYEKN